MKQLVYHIIVCGMAFLFLSACEKDDDISGRSMEKNGTSGWRAVKPVTVRSP